MVELFTNSGHPDQTPRSVASDQGLHCLPDTCLGSSSLQWIKSITYWNLCQQSCILGKRKQTLLLISVCLTSPKNRFASS